MCASLLLVFPLHSVLAGPVTALAPVTTADGTLGLCDVLPGNVPGSTVSWAQLAYNAGARTNRWEFRWDRIEPQRGQWSFTADDAAVASSLQAGLDVEGVIDGIPRWATAPGQPPGNGVPRGLALPATRPANLWAAFLRGLVAHYAGHVRYWEIWNEPDLSFFWNGSPDDYFRLLQVAYTTIKATDPNAQVVMAGMVVPDLAFVGHVLGDAVAAARHGAPVPFDIAAWHAYGSAAAFYQNLLRFRALLAAHGFRAAPVWVTEDGFPASNPAGEARQAAYVLQTAAYALAAGVSKVFVYRASDDPSPKTWGLLTAAGAPRAGYVAYQVAAEFFDGATDVTYAPTANLERFELYEGARRVTLLWNHGLRDRTTSLAAGQATGTLVDWSGTQSQIMAEGASFHLTVPGALYNNGIDPVGVVVGGPPIMVAQDNATAPGALSVQSYLAPVPGLRRSVVMLNPGETGITVDIAAGNPTEHQSFSLAPHVITAVDLDLLGGIGYHGTYGIRSTAPLPIAAASSRATVAAVQPSVNWYLSNTPPLLALNNPQGAPAKVELSRYDADGRRVERSSLTLGVGAQSTWAPARTVHGRTSLVIRATEPVIAAASAGQPVPAPQTAWYVMRPDGSALTLFNPAKAASRLDVRFIGAPTVKREQLHLAGQHSFVLSTHGAGAVMVTGTGGVVVEYSRQPAPGATVLAQPLTQEGLAAAGTTTRVDLFNPASQPAHISLSLLTGNKTRAVERVIAPLHLSSFTVRRATGPPTGVLLSSDVAVVAAPAS